VPRLPPVMSSVVAEPVHIIDGVTVAKLAKVEGTFTIIVVLIQEVVLHIPSALT
jgi:hypothetical protein